MLQTFRSALVALFVVVAAAPAAADPRLVRVIWDVGGGKVYHRSQSRTTTGHDAFVVPTSAVEAQAAGFGQAEGFDIVRKGDRVRVYVVNYNAAAHVWHDSSAVEQVLPEPSLATAILNAVLLSVSGAKAFPGAAFSFPAGAVPLVLPAGCSAATAALNNLVGAANAVHAAGAALLADSQATVLPEQARKLARVPTRPKFWTEFDNGRARSLIRSDTEVFGVDFPATYAGFKTKVEAVDKAIEAANAALLAFDHTIMSAPPGLCQQLDARRDDVHDYLRGFTAADAPVSQLSALYKTSATLWSEYDRKLADWRDVVEVTVKDPVQNEAVVRLDAVFVSPDTKFTERARKSLAIRAERFFPVLTISTGVGFNWFNLKKLQVQQVVVDGAVKSRLAIVDDTTLDRITPVWTQNIRLAAGKEAGLYLMFGTTPDRNIFKNGIFGLSVVVPRWRTSIAAGGFAAKGYEENDLKSIVEQFTSKSTTFMLDGTDLAKVPLPDIPWKVSGYVSVSFMLVSF